MNITVDLLKSLSGEEHLIYDNELKFSKERGNIVVNSEEIGFFTRSFLRDIKKYGSFTDEQVQYAFNKEFKSIIERVENEIVNKTSENLLLNSTDYVVSIFDNMSEIKAHAYLLGEIEGTNYVVLNIRHNSNPFVSIVEFNKFLEIYSVDKYFYQKSVVPNEKSPINYILRNKEIFLKDVKDIHKFSNDFKKYLDDDYIENTVALGSFNHLSKNQIKPDWFEYVIMRYFSFAKYTGSFETTKYELNFRASSIYNDMRIQEKEINVENKNVLVNDVSCYVKPFSKLSDSFYQDLVVTLSGNPMNIYSHVALPDDLFMENPELFNNVVKYLKDLNENNRKLTKIQQNPKNKFDTFKKVENLYKKVTELNELDLYAYYSAKRPINKELNSKKLYTKKDDKYSFSDCGVTFTSFNDINDGDYIKAKGMLKTDIDLVLYILLENNNFNVETIYDTIEDFLNYYSVEETLINEDNIEMIYDSVFQTFNIVGIGDYDVHTSNIEFDTPIPKLNEKSKYIKDILEIYLKE